MLADVSEDVQNYLDNMESKFVIKPQICVCVRIIRID